MNGVPADVVFAEHMKDEAFRREYEALQPEFDAIYERRKSDAMKVISLREAERRATKALLDAERRRQDERRREAEFYKRLDREPTLLERFRLLRDVSHDFLKGAGCAALFVVASALAILAAGAAQAVIVKLIGG